MKLGCRSFETVSPPATAFRTENHLASYSPSTSAGTLYVPREVPATHLRAPRGASAIGGSVARALLRKAPRFARRPT